MVTTVGKLRELLKDYPRDMVIKSEQLCDFVHIVNIEDVVILSTKKPIGWCNRTGDYVYPSMVRGYSAYSPALDEDLISVEWTPILKDKKGKDIKHGSTVDVDAPGDNDGHLAPFIGEVINPSEDGLVVVEDMFGDSWVIDPELITVNNE
jgi:hypothetical protein